MMEKILSYIMIIAVGGYILSRLICKLFEIFYMLTKNEEKYQEFSEKSYGRGMTLLLVASSVSIIIFFLIFIR